MEVYERTPEIFGGIAGGSMTVDLEAQLLFALDGASGPVPLPTLVEQTGYPEYTVRQILAKLLRSKEVYAHYPQGYTLAKVKPPQECVFLEIATMRDGSKVWTCEFFSPKMGEKPMVLTWDRAQKCRSGVPCDYKLNGRR